jgi:tetratricopeptide (TPR) repeat protein
MKSIFLNNLLTLLLCSVGFVSFAQPDPRLADDLLKKGDYFGAMKIYNNLLKLDKNDAEYNYKMGVCILKANTDSKEALRYLKKAMEQPKHDVEVAYYLSLAYAHHLQYDETKKHLEIYLQKPGKNKAEAENWLKNFDKTLSLVSNPVNVTIENMGNKINSSEPDYYPFVNNDETLVVFTSRRKSGKGKIEFDGYYTSDVYYCTFDGENFSLPKLAGNVNTPANEQCTGLSNSGDTMFLYSDRNPLGEIFIAPRVSGLFNKKIKLAIIDEEKYLESAACVSPDGNTIFYSSNMKNGSIGGFDLWMIRKLPTGDWALPQNLGDVINTPFHEDFPALSPDGKTLYFSSTGHPGLGGWDLYKSEWDPETNTFSPPVNLGFPINTADDERTISIAADGKHGYYSAVRDDGYGDLDVYRITFNKVEVNPATFRISLTDGNELLKEGQIIATSKSGELVGEFKPNKSGVFTIMLPPGEYILEIEVPGKPLKEEKLKVSEFHYKMGLIEKQIILAGN